MGGGLSGLAEYINSGRRRAWRLPRREVVGVNSRANTRVLTRRLGRHAPSVKDLPKPSRATMFRCKEEG